MRVAPDAGENAEVLTRSAESRRALCPAWRNSKMRLPGDHTWNAARGVEIPGLRPFVATAIKSRGGRLRLVFGRLAMAAALTGIERANQRCCPDPVKLILVFQCRAVRLKPGALWSHDVVTRTEPRLVPVTSTDGLNFRLLTGNLNTAGQLPSGVIRE